LPPSIKALQSTLPQGFTSLTEQTIPRITKLRQRQYSETQNREAENRDLLEKD